MQSIFAVEVSEGWIGAIFAGLVLVIGALGAWVVKIRHGDSEDRLAEKAADAASKATTFSEMQTIVQQLTARVSTLEASKDAMAKEITVLTGKVAACEAREAAALAMKAETGTHRPVMGIEGADQ